MEGPNASSSQCQAADVSRRVTPSRSQNERSRPGLEPPVFGEILVEGLDDLLSHLVAAS